MSVAGALNEPGQVTIDGKPVSVDALGAFTGALPVTGGTNTFTVAATDVSGNTTTQAYELGVTGQTRTFTYDANGNMTSDGTRTFEWDARNQLVAVSSGGGRVEYEFNAGGRRVRAIRREGGTVQSDSWAIWCDMAVCEERVVGGPTTRHFDLGSESGLGEAFLFQDHLASIADVVDGSGAIAARYAYSPFGDVQRVAGLRDFGPGFSAHYLELAQGLSLAPFRGYDGSLGRWLSPDPAGRIDGPNLYVYVANNHDDLRVQQRWPQESIEHDGARPTSTIRSGAWWARGTPWAGPWCGSGASAAGSMR